MYPPAKWDEGQRGQDPPTIIEEGEMKPMSRIVTTRHREIADRLDRATRRLDQIDPSQSTGDFVGGLVTVCRDLIAVARQLNDACEERTVEGVVR